VDTKNDVHEWPHWVSAEGKPMAASESPRLAIRNAKLALLCTIARHYVASASNQMRRSAIALKVSMR
jgi:hypothetical protein